MKYYYIVIVILILITSPIVSYSQQSQTEVWSKTRVHKVQGNEYVTGYRSVSIGYDSSDGLYVTLVASRSNHDGDEVSLRLHGGKYEKFKEIITTYSKWKKAATAGNTALEKLMYQTDEGIFFENSKREKLVGLNQNLKNLNLKVFYRNGGLDFEIEGDDSFSHSISLNKTEMTTLVAVFINKSRISEVENKLESKADSWDSFEPIKDL